MADDARHYQDESKYRNQVLALLAEVCRERQRWCDRGRFCICTDALCLVPEVSDAFDDGGFGGAPSDGEALTGKRQCAVFHSCELAHASFDALGAVRTIHARDTVASFAVWCHEVRLLQV